MSTVVVHRVNTPRGLVATVHHARHFLSRLRGPLGSKQLAEDGGSLITPCSRVHTLGMCTPLDIVFLDANGAVMKCTQVTLKKGHVRSASAPSGSFALSAHKLAPS